MVLPLLVTALVLAQSPETNTVDPPAGSPPLVEGTTTVLSRPVVEPEPIEDGLPELDDLDAGEDSLELDALEPTEPVEPTSLADAILRGRSWLDTRYRFEAAELRGTPQRGWASTLRGALGHETLSYGGFSALVELESVFHLFSDPFNDSANGAVSRALIPDPDGTEINQAFLRYDEWDGLDVTLGRQEIRLGNERFVGPDPWRQNHQSFDALRLRYDVNENVDLDYTYASRVLRVFGRQNPFGTEGMSTHFLQAQGRSDSYGRLSGYAILADFDDSVALSSNTYGIRYGYTYSREFSESAHRLLAERTAVFDVNLEYAHQEDAGDNPFQVDADYILVEGSAKLSNLQLRLATERLGGSGQAGDKFSTPFASYHGFNGFADQFRNTPDQGLIDRSIGLAYSDDLDFLPRPFTFSVTYHWFDSDAGDLGYGRELDLDLLLPLSDRVSLGARYADFNADQVFRQTNRAMLWGSFRLF